MNLFCSHCRRPARWGSLGRCPSCGAILRIVYSEASLAELGRISPGYGLQRFQKVLPTSLPLTGLEEGATPLLSAPQPGLPAGVECYLKWEGRNPSGSFKDRVAALAVTLARESGAEGLLTASSGNSASAMATYCAAAGLPCTVLIEAGNPVTKIRQILAMGARLLAVEKLFQPGPEAVHQLLSEVCARLGYYLGFAWAPVNPYLTEALKTISYEIHRQLEEPPDWIVTPVGGGDLLHGMWKGWTELRDLGMAPRIPRFAGVQSAAAPPLVRAFREHQHHVPELDFARSRVSGINVPFSGDHGLMAIRDSDGCALAVEDEQIFETQSELARRHGVWVEPAGAAPVAALGALFEEGWAGPGDRVVCILSGAGFKDPCLAQEEAEAVLRTPPCPRDADRVISCLRVTSSSPRG